MNRFVTIAAGIAGCIALAAPVAAQGPLLPLAAPPPGGTATASTIFDAMLAISRAATSNPRAAQTASFSYAAAIQQYDAGDLDRARRSAVQAIQQTDAPIPIQPQAPSNYAKDWYAQMPPVDSVERSDREAQLDLARHALLNCGSTSSAAFVAARPLYDRAVQSEIAGRDADVRRDVAAIVDGCAVTPPPAANAATPGT